MPVTRRPNTSKAATHPRAGKSGVKARRAATKATSPRSTGAGDNRAVRRAVGAAMFDPAVFMGLYEDCAPERARHWADAKGAAQQGEPPSSPAPKRPRRQKAAKGR